MPKKEAKKEIGLETGKQKTLKTLSKILHVLAILANICLWVGLVCLLILTVVFPIIAKDVNVSREEISYKDHRIELREKDEKLDIYYKDKKIGDIETTEKEILLKLIDEINERKLVYVIEVALIVATVSIILTIIIMGYAIKIFKNINEQSTPFIADNVKYLRRIGYLMIAAFVIAIIGSGIISAIAIKTLNFSFDLFSIGEILIIFVLSYIFEYGCSLQEKTEAQIYE